MSVFKTLDISSNTTDKIFVYGVQPHTGVVGAWSVQIENQTKKPIEIIGSDRIEINGSGQHPSYLINNERSCIEIDPEDRFSITFDGSGSMQPIVSDKNYFFVRHPTELFPEFELRATDIGGPKYLEVPDTSNALSFEFIELTAALSEGEPGKYTVVINEVGDDDAIILNGLEAECDVSDDRTIFPAVFQLEGGKKYDIYVQKKDDDNPTQTKIPYGNVGFHLLSRHADPPVKLMGQTELVFNYPLSKPYTDAGVKVNDKERSEGLVTKVIFRDDKQKNLADVGKEIGVYTIEYNTLGVLPEISVQRRVSVTGEETDWELTEKDGNNAPTIAIIAVCAVIGLGAVISFFIYLYYNRKKKDVIVDVNENVPPETVIQPDQMSKFKVY